LEPQKRKDPAGVESATLYVTAVPIGNLGDISQRAEHVLSWVDAVLAEDTRRTGLLLKRLGIEAKRFISLHEHNEEQRIAMVLRELAEGKSLALVSDAGTPLLSDPGYRIVDAVRTAGHSVRPVPGASALTAALSACGLPPYPFTFLGFLPRAEGQVKVLLEKHADTGATLVFFERKNRLAKVLDLAFEVLGDRRCCVARELTKIHEHFILLKLSERDEVEIPELGEFTIVIEPASKDARTSQDEVLEILSQSMGEEMKPKKKAAETAARVRGWSSKEVYALLLQMKNKT
jgi:16S rRNA (cytidine1402-2'-O)-methyltransferase